MKNSKLSLQSLRLFKLLACDPERALVDGASDAGHGLGGQRAGGTFLHPLCSHLQLRLAEVRDHPLAVDAEQIGDVAGVCLVLDLSLLVLEEWIKVMQMQSAISALYLSDRVSCFVVHV